MQIFLLKLPKRRPCRACHYQRQYQRRTRTLRSAGPNPSFQCSPSATLVKALSPDRSPGSLRHHGELRIVQQRRGSMVGRAGGIPQSLLHGVLERMETPTAE